METTTHNLTSNYERHHHSRFKDGVYQFEQYLPTYLFSIQYQNDIFDSLSKIFEGCKISDTDEGLVITGDVNINLSEFMRSYTLRESCWLGVQEGVGPDGQSFEMLYIGSTHSMGSFYYIYVKEIRGNFEIIPGNDLRMGIPRDLVIRPRMITGDLKISTAQKHLSLHGIDKVGGRVILNSSPQVSRLDYLPLYIGGLKIYNTNLREIIFRPHYHIHGDLDIQTTRISHMENLEAVDGCSHLNTIHMNPTHNFLGGINWGPKIFQGTDYILKLPPVIHGDLILNSSYNFPVNLEEVKEVQGCVFLHKVKLPPVIEKFPYVEENIVISGCTHLEEIRGFQEGIFNGSINIRNNNRLTRLCLPEQQVTGNISILNCPIEKIDKIPLVGDTLTIIGTNADSLPPIKWCSNLSLIGMNIESLPDIHANTVKLEGLFNVTDLTGLPDTLDQLAIDVRHLQSLRGISGKIRELIYDTEQVTNLDEFDDRQLLTCEIEKLRVKGKGTYASKLYRKLATI